MNLSKAFSSFFSILFVLFIVQNTFSKSPLNDTIPNLKVQLNTKNTEILKKGAAVSSSTWNDPSKKYWYLRNKSINVGWYYTWGTEWENGNDSLFASNIEFVPMLWGSKYADFSSQTGKIAQKALQWQVNNHKIKYLLGFNEPDGIRQANMTPQEAIDLWPNLMSFNVPLGSPVPAAVMGNGGKWLDEFLRLAREKKYRVDFICIHSYPQNAAGFKKVVTSAWKRYGMPIWVTEFCLQDPNATKTVPNRFTEDDVIAFMADVLPWLDAQPYIKRYAWFGAQNPKKGKFNLTSSQLFNPQTGELTRVGQYYSNYKSVPEGSY